MTTKRIVSIWCIYVVIVVHHSIRFVALDWITLFIFLFTTPPLFIPSLSLSLPRHLSLYLTIRVFFLLILALYFICCIHRNRFNKLTANVSFLFIIWLCCCWCRLLPLPFCDCWLYTISLLHNSVCMQRSLHRRSYWIWNEWILRCCCKFCDSIFNAHNIFKALEYQIGRSDCSE